MKEILKRITVLAGVVVLLFAQALFAQPGETKTVDGIKAALVATPSKNMVDLVLTDSQTGKEIVNAKVFVKIKGPDAKVQEKEFLGMKMGESFSYMNTLDMANKGGYSFEITVETEKKKAKFNFVYEVK